MRRFQWWIFLTLTAIMYQTRTIAQSDAGTAARSENIRELLGRSVAYREANPIEKIYLHTDKQSYTVGETIWFKAYTVVGNENLLSNISNIAYAELIDPKDQVVASVRIPILQGLGRGDFTLIDTLIEGTYRLRAYTNWMRNDSSTYFFSKNIQISNGRADNILSRSLLTDNGNYEIYLQDLKGIGLADEEIQYTVSRDGKTLRRGRGRTDPMGRVEIPYRENFAGARLSILFNNPAQSVVEKVFKLPNVTVRENSIQFFPEGGASANRCAQPNRRQIHPPRRFGYRQHDKNRNNGRRHHSYSGNQLAGHGIGPAVYRGDRYAVCSYGI